MKKNKDLTFEYTKIEIKDRMNLSRKKRAFQEAHEITVENLSKWKKAQDSLISEKDKIVLKQNWIDSHKKYNKAKEEWEEINDRIEFIKEINEFLKSKK